MNKTTKYALFIALLSLGKGFYSMESQELIPNTSLIKAVIDNDLGKVKELINAKADLDIQDDNQATALMWAIREKNNDIAKELIEAKANLDIQGPQKLTALMLAVFEKNNDIVRKLVEAGADLNMRGAGQWTVLMIAAAEGCLDIVKLLLSYGAYFNSLNKDGNKAIDIARKTAIVRNSTEQPYMEIVALLHDIQQATEELKMPFLLATIFDKYSHLQKILIKRFIALGQNNMLKEVVNLASVGTHYSNLLDIILRDPYFNNKFKQLPAYKEYKKGIAFYTGSLRNLILKGKDFHEAIKKNPFSDITIITQDN